MRVYFYKDESERLVIKEGQAEYVNEEICRCVPDGHEDNLEIVELMKLALKRGFRIRSGEFSVNSLCEITEDGMTARFESFYDFCYITDEDGKWIKDLLEKYMVANEDAKALDPHRVCPMCNSKLED